MMGRRGFLLGLVGAATPLSRACAPAVALIEQAVGRREVDAAVLHVTRGRQSFVRGFGAARAETVFLLASLTKPMTAAGVMALVEAGRLSLDEPLGADAPALALAPAERRAALGALTLRQLLCHTSGLPDMPPQNLALRARHAGLDDFLADALAVPLTFAPGTRVRYQSMGFLLAAKVVERVTGLPFRRHLARTLFEPLGMKACSLGLGGRTVAATARCQVPEDAGGWNSPYWRDLGAPWGGAHGTAGDLARWLRAFAGGPGAEKLPLSAKALVAMRTLATPPGETAYGLGFRLGGFAPGVSPRTFGHGGATGVVAWMDPDRDLTCVLLTTLPEAKSSATLLRPVSEVVAGIA
jgi:CubicO group peptidase (beta-lactamase class C family)